MGSDRYEDLGLLAVGAMGEVRRVRDLLLRSVVAMKLSLPHVTADPILRRRFLDEARLTAQLHHPGILAVHDLGERPDGRLFFTMEEVRGRTLAAALPELSLSDGVRVLVRVGRALGHAHGHGVVHRDLKPDNVMLAAHGEVRVMDWGLARHLDEGEPFASVDLGPRDATQTQIGQVVGTVAWMAPEQARGHRPTVGPEVDVYALGALLYALLTGRPPYDGPRAWHDLVAGPPPAPTDGPRTLRELCARAMARRPVDRPEGADEVADALEAWLEEEDALRLVAQARALLPGAEASLALAREAEGRARAHLAEVPSFAPSERKIAGWRLQDEAAAHRREARRVEIEVVQLLRSALVRAPALREAHDLLAAHYRDRLEDAESRRDPDAAAGFEALLREHDRGEHTAWLQGGGSLTLLTDPPAEVSWCRIVERDRRLVAEPGRPLGTTPLVGVGLPRGSHLLVLTAPGCPPAAVPVQLDRAARWDSVPPDAAEPRVLRLPREGELGPDERWIPEGWFWSGGDPDAPDGLPARRWWVDAFVMRRDPVTVGEYLAFVNALREPVERWLPRDAGGSASLFLAEGGRFVLDPAAGERSHPDAPVTDVDWWCARRYAEFLADRTGLPWRLPTELEWEKAARGVDRRRTPWGEQLEPTWANVAGSRPGPPGLAPIDTFPVDESPYGVRGLAGNVRDWCADRYLRFGPPAGLEQAPGPETSPPSDDTFLVMRGGAWPSTPGQLRVAGRFADTPGRRYRTLGFRLCRSFPA